MAVLRSHAGFLLVGTAAERAGYTTTSLRTGIIWYESDTTATYIWSGSAWISLGGAAAPVNAEYVVLALNGTLTDERVLTAGNNVTLTDGGAGGAATLDVDTVPNHDHTGDAGDGGQVAIAAISDIPGTIATILTDHTKAIHDALGLDLDTLVGSILLSTPLYGLFQYATDQTITHATWNTIQVAEISDPAGIFTVSSYAVYPTVAGWYLCLGCVTFDANASGIRRSRVYYNNTKASMHFTITTTAALNAQAGSYGIFYFDGTSADYVYFQAFQNSGGDLTSFASASGELHKNTLQMIRIA